MKETESSHLEDLERSEKNGNSIRTLMESTAGNSWMYRVDGAVLTSAANCRYLSGFASSAHTVFVTKEETYFLTNFDMARLPARRVRTARWSPTSGWKKAWKRLSVVTS